MGAMSDLDIDLQLYWASLVDARKQGRLEIAERVATRVKSNWPAAAWDYIEQEMERIRAKEGMQ